MTPSASLPASIAKLIEPLEELDVFIVNAADYLNRHRVIRAADPVIDVACHQLEKELALAVTAAVHIKAIVMTTSEVL